MTDPVRLLYVDDEPDLLELAKIFLEQSRQFAVDTAVSAAEALDAPLLLSYDAIVSDYQMPVMDGIAFLKEVRQRSEKIPFILFTGRGREEVVIQAINYGADFYLQKGGAPEAQFAELAHKVRQAVARRQSESEITSIFQAVPVGIGVVANRVLLRVNDRLCTITGYPREELEGKNTRFLYVNEEDYVLVGKMREQAYRGDVPGEIAVAWMKKDGSVIDVLISAAAIDRSNPVAAMTYSALDITRARRDHRELLAAYEQITAAEEELRTQYEELAQNEQQLRESQERLRAFMDSTDDAISIWDKDFRLIDINLAAFRYLPPGTKKETILERPYAELFPHGSTPERKEQYLAVLRTGIPYSTTFEIPSLEDGSMNWYAIRAFRVGSGIAITSSNITTVKNSEQELKAAYEQLKASEVKLREQVAELARSEAEITGILRAAPVSIGLMSPDRIFRRVNDRFCELTGYSRDELIGRHARLLYPDDDEFHRAGKFYALRTRGDGSGAVETRFLRKDGAVRDIRLFGSLVDQDNPAAGNIFIAIDITDEKQGRADAGG